MNCDVCIVGGGLNGCTLALALNRQGIGTVLIDSAPPLDGPPAPAEPFDSRAYAISAGSQRMLAKLELWDNLAGTAGEIREIKVTDGRIGHGPGRFWLHFDHRDIHAENGDGPMGWMVEDRHLRQELMRAMTAAPLITLAQGTSVVAQDTTPSGVSATLSTGEHIHARLLVGADGRASSTAQRARIRRTHKPYTQTAIVCTIEHDENHQNVAHQFFVPAGPLAILPLSGGHRSCIVLSEETAQAGRMTALSDEDFLTALSARVGSFLGDIRLGGRRYGYPLGRLMAYRFVAQRVALIGDAAHVMHPLAGQGLNVGLRDVAALAHVLEEARKLGTDVGCASVLAQYERWRRFDAASLIGVTDTLNALFSMDNAPARFARSVGLWAVGGIPSLQRQFILQAAGLSGTLPKLMEREA